VLFIATCIPGDEEMRAVDRRAERLPGWRTEEGGDVAGALAGATPPSSTA
jgi:hypothetical protein